MHRKLVGLPACVVCITHKQSQPSHAKQAKLPSKHNQSCCCTRKDVLKRGLKYVGVKTRKHFSRAALVALFRKHYGSLPMDLAEMWYDLCSTDIPAARLNGNEKLERGFKLFMAAHFFLWTYPKNSNLLSSRFDICERNSRGVVEVDKEDSSFESKENCMG